MATFFPAGTEKLTLSNIFFSSKYENETFLNSIFPIGLSRAIAFGAS
jgi:hypothetical protein